MTGTTISRLKHVKAGDTVWHYDPQAHRYDENRKSQGRGVWSLRTVLKVARKYLTLIGGGEYEVDGGMERQHRSGISSQSFVAGNLDRDDWTVRQRAWRIGDRVRQASADKLRRIEALLDEPEAAYE